jgi:hypothetical protein
MRLTLSVSPALSIFWTQLNPNIFSKKDYPQLPQWECKRFPKKVPKNDGISTDDCAKVWRNVCRNGRAHGPSFQHYSVSLCSIFDLFDTAIGLSTGNSVNRWELYICTHWIYTKKYCRIVAKLDSRPICHVFTQKGRGNNKSVGFLNTLVRRKCVHSLNES